MKVIELHLVNSGKRVCIPLQAITQVSESGNSNSSFVIKADGRDVEVQETYQDITKLLQEIQE